MAEKKYQNEITEKHKKINQLLAEHLQLLCNKLPTYLQYTQQVGSHEDAIDLAWEIQTLLVEMNALAWSQCPRWRGIL